MCLGEHRPIGSPILIPILVEGCHGVVGVLMPQAWLSCYWLVDTLLGHCLAPWTIRTVNYRHVVANHSGYILLADPLLRGPKVVGRQCVVAPEGAHCYKHMYIICIR